MGLGADPRCTTLLIMGLGAHLHCTELSGMGLQEARTRLHSPISLVFLLCSFMLSAAGGLQEKSFPNPSILLLCSFVLFCVQRAVRPEDPGAAAGGQGEQGQAGALPQAAGVAGEAQEGPQPARSQGVRGRVFPGYAAPPHLTQPLKKELCHGTVQSCSVCCTIVMQPR